MRVLRVLVAAVGVVLAIVGGFALVEAMRDDQDLERRLSAELERERQEFIVESRERLAALTHDMHDLETKAEHDSPYASADDRAEWSQQLFELKQQRGRVEAELDRATQATAEEWKAMRGPIGRTIDTMEAAAEKLRHDVPAIFAPDEADPSPEAPSGER
jgi:hypothetical protein